MYFAVPAIELSHSATVSLSVTAPTHSLSESVRALFTVQVTAINFTLQCVKDSCQSLVKGLSHQNCVLTESARRPEKIQNAMVRAVRSPRAQKQLRGISVGRREDS